MKSIDNLHVYHVNGSPSITVRLYLVMAILAVMPCHASWLSWHATRGSALIEIDMHEKEDSHMIENSC